MQLAHPIFKILSEIAVEKGLEIYVIGGYVRDLILRRPSKDIDIVVLGSGIELAETAAKQLGDLTVSVFKNFGTAMFRYKGVENPIISIPANPLLKKAPSMTIRNGAISRSTPWPYP